MTEAPAPQAAEETLPELITGEGSAAWQQDFEGLLYLGYLTGSFTWCGHEIVIKTLTRREDLIIAALVREWDATIGGSIAYATAVSALAVISVDGRPMPAPLGEDEQRGDKWAQDRFELAQRWYEPTITMIFNQWLRLNARMTEVVSEMGKGQAPAGWSDMPAGHVPEGFFQAAGSP